MEDPVNATVRHSLDGDFEMENLELYVTEEVTPLSEIRLDALIGWKDMLDITFVVWTSHLL